MATFATSDTRWRKTPMFLALFANSNSTLRASLPSESSSDGCTLANRMSELPRDLDLVDILMVLNRFSSCFLFLETAFVLLLFAGGGWLLVVAACRWFSLVAVMFGFMLVEDCVTSIYF